MPHQARNLPYGRSSNSSSLQRQHLEVGIILLSGARLVAAVAALSGGPWPAACLAAVHLLALLLEFCTQPPASPYHLRECDSQGISQGVLAVPSVLAGLAVAAPDGPWLAWLQGSCAAGVATLAIIYAQSSSALRTARSSSVAVLKATAADYNQACSPRQLKNGVARTALQHDSTACNEPRKAGGAATHQLNNKKFLSSSSSSGTVIASAAVVLLALAAVCSPPTFSSSRTAAPMLRAWLRRQAAAELTQQHAGLLAMLLGCVLAPLCYCTIMQLLPGCFSLGEGALMSQGAAGLIVAAATALPSAAAFVPAVVCQQLPSTLWALVAAAGGCTTVAHTRAIGLQGLLAVVVLILASVLAVCLALQLLIAVARPCQNQQHGSRKGSRESSQQHSSTRSSSSQVHGLARRLLPAGLLGMSIVLLLSWLATAAVWTLLELLPARPWRLMVLLYWTGLLAITLPSLKLFAASSTVPQIIVRKVYHLLAGGLFVPVFFWDLQLLSLSLAISFAALVLLEVVRHLQLPWVGQAIQQFMQDFVDARDSGVIYVTHFTLLLGLAVPIWLCLALPGMQAFAGTPQQQQDELLLGHSSLHLSPGTSGDGAGRLSAAAAAGGADGRLLLVMAGLSGMVIIGVGDTAASAVGKLLGRVPIHQGSKKTVEGTVAGIASSLGAWCLLLWCSGLGGGGLGWWVQLVLATAGAGLMEACTSQLDNVLLPLWYLAHLLLVQN